MVMVVITYDRPVVGIPGLDKQRPRRERLLRVWPILGGDLGMLVYTDRFICV